MLIDKLRELGVEHDRDVREFVIAKVDASNRDEVARLANDDGYTLSDQHNIDGETWLTFTKKVVSAEEVATECDARAEKCDMLRKDESDAETRVRLRESACFYRNVVKAIWGVVKFFQEDR